MNVKSEMKTHNPFKDVKKHVLIIGIIGIIILIIGLELRKDTYEDVTYNELEYLYEIPNEIDQWLHHNTDNDLGFHAFNVDDKTYLQYRIGVLYDYEVTFKEVKLNVDKQELHVTLYTGADRPNEDFEANNVERNHPQTTTIKIDEQLDDNLTVHVKYNRESNVGTKKESHKTTIINLNE